ncbi:MAG TPA: hypothetical protein VGH80_12325 [Xanthomonadaceae bacterium]
MQTVTIAMRDLIASSQSRHSVVKPIERSLSFPGVSEAPPAFNRLAHVDFAVISEAEPELEWDDYCPAYALGFLTYEAYCRDARGMAPSELEEQWQALRGASRLKWNQVCAIIARSWNALAGLERTGQL